MIPGLYPYLPKAARVEFGLRGGEPLLIRTIILSKTLAVLPGRLGRIRRNFIAIVAPNSSIEAPPSGYMLSLRRLIVERSHNHVRCCTVHVV